MARKGRERKKMYRRPQVQSSAEFETLALQCNKSTDAGDGATCAESGEVGLSAS